MSKAVIFDMDGVISDTEKFHLFIDEKLIREHGIELRVGELKRYSGVLANEIFKDVFDRAGKTVNVEKISDEKWEQLNEYAKGKINPIEGVVELIKALKDMNFKLVVASSSRQDFIKLVLSELNIREFFDSISSGYEVNLGKPNPAVFLLAAKKLGVQPQECVVIEDAPNGVRAAKNAGMKCIAITTNHAREELREADKIIDSFGELSPDEIIKL